jgi:hypothetical protein
MSTETLRQAPADRIGRGADSEQPPAAESVRAEERELPKVKPVKDAQARTRPPPAAGIPLADFVGRMAGRSPEEADPAKMASMLRREFKWGSRAKPFRLFECRNGSTGCVF